MPSRTLCVSVRAGPEGPKNPGSGPRGWTCPPRVSPSLSKGRRPLSRPNPSPASLPAAGAGQNPTRGRPRHPPGEGAGPAGGASARTPSGWAWLGADSPARWWRCWAPRSEGSEGPAVPAPVGTRVWLRSRPALLPDFRARLSPPSSGPCAARRRRGGASGPRARRHTLPPVPRTRGTFLGTPPSRPPPPRGPRPHLQRGVSPPLRG